LNNNYDLKHYCFDTQSTDKH